MNTNSIHIRRATIEDAETLVNLGGETWIHTYIADRYTPGMHSYVNNIFHPQLLKAQLAESARSFFLIAEMNQAAVGFAQMYDASLLKHISGPAPLELERFYIQDQWLGKGVALYLMLACLNYAQEYGFKTICVADWKYTKHARIFYHHWSRSESGVYYITIDTHRSQRINREIFHSLIM